MVLSCLSRLRTCWDNAVPPTGFVLLGLIVAQVRPRDSGVGYVSIAYSAQTGNGIYPVLVKKFNASANPLIFSMYR